MADESVWPVLCYIIVFFSSKPNFVYDLFYIQAQFWIKVRVGFEFYFSNEQAHDHGHDI